MSTIDPFGLRARDPQVVTQDDRLLQLADLPALKESLRSAVIKDRLLGSQLGNTISKSAASMGKIADFRQFGGMRRFAEYYLSDLFQREPARHPGGDDYYVVSGRQPSLPFTPPQSSSNLGEAVAASGDSKFFWSALTNPAVKAEIYLNSEQAIEICPTGFPTPPTSKKVPRLNAEHYLEWARIYAKKDSSLASDKHVQDFLSTATGETFFSGWNNFLRAKPALGHVKSWEIFRVEQATEFLDRTLADLGAAKEKRAQIAHLLKKSQAGGRRWFAPVAQLDASGRAGVPSRGVDLREPNHRLHSLRQIVHSVVENMSAESLADLNLPLGLTLTAVVQNGGRVGLDDAKEHS